MSFQQLDYLRPISQDGSSIANDFSRDFDSGDLSIWKNDSHKSIYYKKIFSDENLDNEKVKKLFTNINSDIDESFGEACVKFLHQGGILYALQSAITEEACNSDVVMFPNTNMNDINAKRKIFPIPEKNILIIEEEVNVNRIRSTKNPDDVLVGSNDNKNDSPILKAKARYVIHKEANDTWNAQVIDVTFDYKDTRAKKYLDNRSTIKKIKDWFKEHFQSNKSQKKALKVKINPKHMFLTEENNDGSITNKYHGKKISYSTPAA